jgi:YNFM family putative membrane transporter
VPTLVHARSIAAAPADVLAAASEPINTGFAEPADPRVGDSEVRWGSAPDVVEDVERVALIRPEGSGAHLELTGAYHGGVPYFGWVFNPLIRRSLRRTLDHMAAVIQARAEGKDLPRRLRRPLWAPPDRMTESQAAFIATICAILAITAYGGSLFTQTVDYTARSFGADDSSLSIALATTRVGTLVALMGSVFADRRGRRRMLLVSTAGLSIATLASAAAPNFISFTVLQVAARGFTNLAAVVGFIAATEEAPEGARAYTLALASIASAAGFALGSLFLPAADLHPDSWRALYVLGGLGLVALGSLARRLPETRRYTELGVRIRKARASEVIDRTYRGRFATVGATVFLMALMAAPASQLMNRYLGQEHDYTGLDILVLRATTQALPALIAVWLGGRLAESSGRKPVAIWATLVMAVTTAGFFTTGGAALWILLLVSTAAGALSGPSFATFNTELFPTEVRGTAGAGLLALGVAGSAVGILLSGFLSDPLGSLGLAVAITAAGPVIVAAFLIRRLPEARGIQLDQLSPPEV